MRSGGRSVPAEVVGEIPRDGWIERDASAQRAERPKQIVEGHRASVIVLKCGFQGRRHATPIGHPDIPEEKTVSKVGYAPF